ncbi:hypothetical protein QR680_011691 [Steinernema hermaphroditum]|uniref:Nucleolar protein 10 n=1 Tax=Steinernema hermaphroditum TaxID=289476 RepID=A0AA39LZD7_9BILA|nr:hypothetical protein QR680_011691 [Steinernema hermaphroditum]
MEQVKQYRGVPEFKATFYNDQPDSKKKPSWKVAHSKRWIFKFLNQGGFHMKSTLPKFPATDTTNPQNDGTWFASNVHGSNAKENYIHSLGLSYLFPNEPVETGEVDYAQLEIVSRGNLRFKLHEKSSILGTEIYDYVSWDSDYGSSLLVHAWKSGSGGKLPCTCREQEHERFIADVHAIQYEDDDQKYPIQYGTVDHSKWAVEIRRDFIDPDGRQQTTPTPSYVCVADNNRMGSQQDRGGFCMWFRNAQLNLALRCMIHSLRTDGLTPSDLKQIKKYICEGCPNDSPCVKKLLQTLFCTNVYIKCYPDLLTYSPKLNNTKYEVSFKKLRQLIAVPIRGRMDCAGAVNDSNFMAIYDLQKEVDVNGLGPMFFTIPSYLGALHLSGIRGFQTEIEDLVERQPCGYLYSVRMVESDITSRCVNLLIDKFSYKKTMVPGPGLAPRVQSVMYLKFYLNEEGKRVYTLKSKSPSGQETQSAHPARFSPEDQYSKYRITIKKRFGILRTQQGNPTY